MCVSLDFPSTCGQLRDYWISTRRGHIGWLAPHYGCKFGVSNRGSHSAGCLSDARTERSHKLYRFTPQRPICMPILEYFRPDQLRKQIASGIEIPIFAEV